MERAFAVLEALADGDGVHSLSELQDTTGLPGATIHRVVRTLAALGYVRQEGDRRYGLGPRLMRLSDGAMKRLGAWAQPHLVEAVEHLGESVNLAMLDGDEIVYVAQAQPSTALMRMFTEVGRRVLPHATAVGKIALVGHDDDAVYELLHRTGMPRYTDTTIVDPARFVEVLDGVREQGYALDEGEQEAGVRCVAVGVPGAPAPMALSMSGPTTRVDDVAVDRAVRVLTAAAERIGEVLTAG